MDRGATSMWKGTLSIMLLLLFPLFYGCDNGNGTAGGSGFVEADDVLVAAEISGRVIRSNVKEGARVGEGDTLLMIDPSRLELQLNSARAGRGVLEASLRTARVQVEQAETAERFAQTEYERIARLRKAGTANQQQMDRAELERDQAVIGTRTARTQVRTLQAQLTQADADIASLERQLRDCYPLSPVTGTITEKLVDAGELLAPGKGIAVVAPLDTMWVKVYLNAGDFANVRLGDQAEVSTETGGQEFTGRVVWMSDEAEFTPKNVQTEESRADLVYAVKVQVGNPDGVLKIGMPVFVTLGTAVEQ